MNVQQLMENFQRFLVSSWESVDHCCAALDWDSDPYFTEDWLQCNWELLIERMLLSEGQFLCPYGYGFGLKTRFTKRSESFTHYIACSGKDFDGLAFQTFVAKEANMVCCRPPFDHVDLIDLKSREQITYRFQDLCFVLKAWP